MHICNIGSIDDSNTNIENLQRSFSIHQNIWNFYGKHLKK